ncbi:MAG: PKD domain-containing protein [Chitinophagaceae bacterium]
MKRFLLLFWICLVVTITANAAHIKGGFFTYKYLGPGAGTNLRYQITLTVYMICNPSAGQLNNPINFTIFNAGNNQFIQNAGVAISNQYNLGKAYDEPCITGDQTGCYYTIVVYDLPSIELPSTPDGYIVSYQRCCRISGINNVVGSQNVGNTFTIRIPGTASYPGAETNSSPSFLVNDTAVVCKNSFFHLSFQATDIDGDSLTYSFCDAYQGGDAGGNSAPPTAAAPPYASVPYAFPYSGVQPMGPGVTINHRTGLISGTAPNVQGQFVICVCVNEYRNGTLISSTRKELHITVGDCNPLRVQLDPKPTTCNGFDVNFENNATGNPPDAQYLWTFGDPSTGVNDTDYVATTSHHYSDTGIFVVKLIVSLPGGLCADSATLQVKVFPGFTPGFRFTGSCYTRPYSFFDTTKTAYGVVDSWSWNFGDLTTLADTSHIKTPLWTYPSPGPKDVTLIVTNSKGCIDTVQTTIDVLDKPALSLAFRDTLICRNDAVQLSATASGASTYSWSPPVNIVGANTATPTVSPPSDQWYYVDIDENGCTNRDSVFVRVVAAVTLRAINDTTICQGDAIQLNAVSNGLSFTWSPAGNLNNPNIINPIAVTNSPTRYTVVATIGGCTATDFVDVNTVPYPGSNAGPDPRICYNTSGQITGHIVGSSFSWSPTSYLNNPNILNPIASPPRTTRYILTVYDTLGCPKPGLDTVVVIVQPKIRAFAGNDTTVVVGQPLLFNGSGGVSYLWSPGTGLSSTSIFNPIGIYGPNIDSVRYKMIASDVIGCQDSAYVTVYVYKTIPYVFVPTAFTPNNDGLNDVIRPIAVGIRQINYFAIYNRWGERVFYTTANKQGWNGIHNGRIQASGVYVWMLQAIDYTGKSLFLKGTVTLIR